MILSASPRLYAVMSDVLLILAHIVALSYTSHSTPDRRFGAADELGG